MKQKNMATKCKNEKLQMNYIYIYEGVLPKYIKNSLENTLKIDPDANIYFCNNQNYQHENITSVQIESIVSKSTKNILHKEFFKYEPNLLWTRSLNRIFYLRDVVNTLNINKFVHFDADVLIYKPFNEINYKFSSSKFNITPLSEKEIIFGYSCSLNRENFNCIVNKIEEFLIEFTDNESKNLLSKDLNEMKILMKIYNKEPSLFNLLPVIPKEISDEVFDPASYGQYLGGTKDRFSKKFTDENHLPGKMIKEGFIEPKIYNSYPKIVFNNNEFELINLHVHSKKIKKFLPK